METETYTLLAVDDDPTQLELIRAAVSNLEGYNFVLRTAENLAGGVKALHKQHIDLVISDQLLPDGKGIDLLDHVQTLNPDIPVIIITAHESVPDAVHILKRGAVDYLVKPLKAMDIRHAVLRIAEQQARDVDQEQVLDQVVHDPTLHSAVKSNSEQMRSVLSVVARAANSSATVLVEGESGTGKEIIARLLHSASDRKNGPFVVVNCAAIPETLIESELFGAKKGSYTGATTDRKGRFEEANGGTLFVDEVGEIPLSTQVKLLRALQSREIEPIGSNTPVKFNARIIAATNRNLDQMVQSGDFREDLYYRLRVIAIRMPPLRDRKADIPMLVDRFVEKFSEQDGKPISGVTKAARDALMRYDYPGNVRELENAVEHAVVLSRGSVIDVTDLPDQLQTGLRDLPADTLPESAQGKFDREMDALELRLLQEALDENNGNQSAAARSLGIGERRLRSRLARLGLK